MYVVVWPWKNSSRSLSFLLLLACFFIWWSLALWLCFRGPLFAMTQPRWALSFLATASLQLGPTVPSAVPGLCPSTFLSPLHLQFDQTTDRTKERAQQSMVSALQRSLSIDHIAAHMYAVIELTHCLEVLWGSEDNKLIHQTSELIHSVKWNHWRCKNGLLWFPFKKRRYWSDDRICQEGKICCLVPPFPDGVESSLCSCSSGNAVID